MYFRHFSLNFLCLFNLYIKLPLTFLSDHFELTFFTNNLINNLVDILCHMKTKPCIKILQNILINFNVYKKQVL